MLTLVEEMDQWIENKQTVTEELQAAYRFKNVDGIHEICKRLTMIDAMIAACAIKLKENGYSYTKVSTASSIPAHVDVSKDTSIEPACIDLIVTE